MKKGIGSRIMVMAVSISAVAALIGAIGLFSAGKISVLARDMYNRSLLRVQYADSMQDSVETSALLILNAELSGASQKAVADYKSQFVECFQEFEKAADDYESTKLRAAEKKQLLQVIRDSGREYNTKGMVLFEYLEKGELEKGIAYTNSVLVPIRRDKLNPAVDKLTEIQISDAHAAFLESNRISFSAVVIILCSIIIGVVLSLTLGITITRSITKPVTKMVDSLSDSSSQIGISSSQLSSASQEIANGAQEQASSIEETTSSLEELSSMVKQNLENARQASLLAEKAASASRTGSEKMNEMLTAMNNISKSAEDIRNVIDVIDDIAFQTNMLALNAAVEAARAGEAGMGFAVVADEVKNLANRSSDSAKETASMIKETLRNVEDGMSITKQLADIFRNDVTNAEKVLDVNKEVEAASGQQDQGISQVNAAMIQFDTVVQANASSAEETAGAAEELQSQVTSLNEVVESLYLIVSGTSYRDRTAAAAVQPEDGTAGPVNSVRSERAQPRRDPDPRRRQPEKTAGKKPVREGAPEGTGRKDTAGKKETAGRRNEAGAGVHSISFENDEDFKPV